MNFYAIRYFVVKSSLTLFPLDEGLKPKDLFIQPLVNRLETKYYNRTYTARILNDNPKERYLAGYLLKSTDTHLIQLDKDLFNESDIPNWEKLFFDIDTERQIVIFEYNTPIATPENVKNVLHQLINKSANQSGYEVKLDFLVDKFAFWDIIKESVGIYQIAFNLNAPNLFGGSKKANEWLKNLKEKHNMTNVGFDFRNENSELNYDQEELESYRDYADSGGGSWTLGVLQNGRKKKYKSVNHLRRKEVEINTNDPREIKRALLIIINRLQLIIDSLDDN
ncbi:MAG: hypothetical protein KA210_05040 [Bacteroidia bacterium]|nr:hypothetical protein [Bacteroidia bacterium]